MTLNGGPPVDLEGFRHSMREAGIEEIVEPTLDLYVEEAGSLFSALAAAVSSGDMETARQKAHALKSSSGNVWAKELAALLERLEVTAQDGDGAGASGLFGQVQVAYDVAITYIAESSAGP